MKAPNTGLIFCFQTRPLVSLSNHSSRPLYVRLASIANVGQPSLSYCRLRGVRMRKEGLPPRAPSPRREKYPTPYTEEVLISSHFVNQFMCIA
jgi:hypothetical protein